MNVDQDDIDVIYENLISQYVGGEEAIVYLFRSKSPTLRENMNQAMTEYDDAFTPVEQDFIYTHWSSVLLPRRRKPLRRLTNRKRRPQRRLANKKRRP
ncbi:hypothetical protein CEQ31_026600 [Serratia odorifera]|nr:hypothetical protein CEQ31_026600 [Serratia odorifera]